MHVSFGTSSVYKDLRSCWHIVVVEKLYHSSKSRIRYVVLGEARNSSFQSFSL